MTQLVARHQVTVSRLDRLIVDDFDVARLEALIALADAMLLEQRFNHVVFTKESDRLNCQCAACAYDRARRALSC